MLRIHNLISVEKSSSRNDIEELVQAREARLPAQDSTNYRFEHSSRIYPTTKEKHPF